MAESLDNYITHGMSGKLGNLLVFRQWFGKTIVGKRPRKVGTFTSKQQAIRAKFQQAAAYAKTALADAATLQAYKDKTLPGQTAFNLAMADYFLAPTITKIDHSSYSGAAGNKIKIAALDDFMVQKVDVAIHRPDGTLLEQGVAVADPDGIHWIYMTTQANGTMSGSKITATATDLPANVTVKDEILP